MVESDNEFSGSSMGGSLSQNSSEAPLQETPPFTPRQSSFNDSLVLNLVYVESIKKKSYDQWLAEENKKLTPVKPATAENLEEMDTPTKERHGIGYISENFLSWTRLLDDDEEAGAMIPTVDEIQALRGGFLDFAIVYQHDGLKWRSDVRVCRERQIGTTVNSLVVHFPNDGFFYVEESLLPVLSSNRDNPKHMKTCPKGWAYLERSLWAELQPFETWARKWFGYDDDKKLKRQILYHAPENRMDICLLCPETNVSAVFVFEPGYPEPEVPEEFWF